jgi:hypothetical protein
VLDMVAASVSQALCAVLGSMVVVLRRSADVLQGCHQPCMCHTATYRYVLIDTDLFCSCFQNMDFSLSLNQGTIFFL